MSLEEQIEILKEGRKAAKEKIETYQRLEKKYTKMIKTLKNERTKNI